MFVFCVFVSLVCVLFFGGWVGVACVERFNYHEEFSKCLIFMLNTRLN